MNRDELQITKDLLSAVNDQKRDLEYQNRELRDRIETVENSRLDIAQAAAGAQRANLPIPPLNISHEWDGLVKLKFIRTVFKFTSLSRQLIFIFIKGPKWWHRLPLLSE